MIIDCHVHTEAAWSEPIEILNYQMELNGVSHAVLTQLNGRYDNSYLVECTKRFPGRFKIVGGIDAMAPGRLKQLETLHAQGGSGIRINIRTDRDWGPDNEHFRLAGEFGMIISVIGAAKEFASARFKKLLDDCPDTHFNLEHLVRNPGNDVTKPPYDLYKQALECAKWSNTSTKVPGLGEILIRPEVMPIKTPWEIPPHYEMAKEAFGVKRMMWGSNAPTCGRCEGYANALNWVRDLPCFKGDDADWVMGKSAAKLWGFPG